MNKNRKLVFIAMYVALAIVLDLIKEMIPFLNMPSGGSVNIALIPVVLCSFHLGVKEGCITGALWWGITTIMGMNEWFISVPQYLADYIVPSVVVGASAFMFGRNKSVIAMEIGIFVTMLVRCFCLCLSGAVFWVDGAASGTLESWVASAVYNVPYTAATMVMLMVVVPILFNSLKKYLL